MRIIAPGFPPRDIAYTRQKDGTLCEREILAFRLSKIPEGLILKLSDLLHLKHRT